MHAVGAVLHLTHLVDFFFLWQARRHVALLRGLLSLMTENYRKNNKKLKRIFFLITEFFFEIILEISCRHCLVSMFLSCRHCLVSMILNGLPCS